jgi:hypothetical protein
MAYVCAGLCTYFESRPKKCKITAKIGKKTEKIYWAIKLYHAAIFAKFDPKFQNFAISVTPYIGNTNIKNIKSFQKKFIAGGFTTVEWQPHSKIACSFRNSYS